MFIQDSKALHHSWHSIWEGQTRKAGNYLPKIYLGCRLIFKISESSQLLFINLGYILLSTFVLPLTHFGTQRLSMQALVYFEFPSFSQHAIMLAFFFMCIYPCCLLSKHFLMTKYHFCVQNFHHQQFLQAPITPPPLLSSFAPSTEEEVRRIIMSSSDTSCDLDVIPLSVTMA